MARIITDLPIGGWHVEHALVNYRLQDDQLHAIWWAAALPSPSHLPQILLRLGFAFSLEMDNLGHAGLGQIICWNLFDGECKPVPTTIEQASPWLQGRTFASWREQFDSRGYLIFERVLSPDRVAEIRTALAPYLERDLTGRNDFEGLKTNRVYALLAKSQLFAELAIHPLALAFAEAELGPSCLLSALLAINLHPGETVQPWHFDDGGIRVPRPRPALGISAFWAIDDTTELNGSTEVIPGSHLWDGQASRGR
jgi:phytanoyl-CoA dioxygenase PhyH